MANSRTGNVIFVDTTGYSLTDITRVIGVKYIGAASGTASVTSTTGSKPLWEQSGSTNSMDYLKFRSDSGITVTLTNGAKVYIYLDVEM